MPGAANASPIVAASNAAMTAAVETAAAAATSEAMRTAHERRPLRVQRRGLVRELGVACMQDAQIVERERMLLDRHVMKPAAARGVALPRLPRREKVESHAEARFQDDEPLAASPALGQAVALQEHVARLLEAARRAVVDVAERGRIGRVVAEIELRRDQRCHGAGIIDAPARGRQ